METIYIELTRWEAIVDFGLRNDYDIDRATYYGNASNLFRREFRFKCPMIMLFLYLTRISNKERGLLMI